MVSESIRTFSILLKMAFIREWKLWCVTRYIWGQSQLTANPQCELRDCGRLMEVCWVSFFKRIVLLVLILLQFRISFGSQANFMYSAWMRTHGVQDFLDALWSPNSSQYIDPVLVIGHNKWPLALILLWSCRFLYFASVDPTTSSLCWDPRHYLFSLKCWWYHLVLSCLITFR